MISDLYFNEGRNDSGKNTCDKNTYRAPPFFNHFRV